MIGLPILKDGMTEVQELFKIINYLKKKGYNIDETAGLSKSELAESLAFSALIENNLYDALLYIMWLENENNAKKTQQQTYNKSLSFIERYFLQGKIQETAKERLKDMELVKVNDELVPEVYLNAHDAYASLSTKLGNKKYFFGDKPSTLDAIAYGHLALHCYPNLQNPKLFTMISFEFPNLIQFCQRITTFFKDQKINRIPLPKPIYNQITDKSKECIKSACSSITSYDYKEGINHCKENIVNCKDNIMNYNYKESFVQCKDNIMNYNYRENINQNINQCREYVSNHKISFDDIKESIKNFKFSDISNYFKKDTSNMSYYERNEQNKKQIVNSRVLSVVGALTFFTFYIVHNKIIRVEVRPEPPINH
jgi:glutathione S-transferase